MKNLYALLLTFALFSLTLSAQDYEITFEVDMTDFVDGGGTIDPTGMHVAGSWQAAAGLPGDWTPMDAPLTDQGNNVWSATFTIPPGTYEYKYVLGNDWAFGSENITGACGPGNGNRQLEADADKTVAFCYDKCTACGVTTPKVNVTFQVDMSNMITRFGETDTVSVAGGFQGWAPGETIMTDDNEDGIYEVTYEVDANSTLNYKFLFGADWGYEEGIPAACNVGGNRSVEVADTDVTLPVVCYGTCDENCPTLGAPVNVTFLVDMSNEIVSADGVHLAGTLQFPSWRKDEWEMTDVDGNGVYSLRIENLFPGEYQYKFINGTQDSEEEMADFIAAGCGVDNGIGGSNRLLDLTGASGEIVVKFVYNTCDEATNTTADDEDNAPVIVLGTPASVNNTTSIEGIDIYPNPFTSSTTIEINNPNNDVFNLVITDFTGKTVMIKNDIRDDVITIQRNNLPSGIYFATFRDNNGGLLTQKLVIQ